MPLIVTADHVVIGSGYSQEVHGFAPYRVLRFVVSFYDSHIVCNRFTLPVWRKFHGDNDFHRLGGVEFTDETSRKVTFDDSVDEVNSN